MAEQFELANQATDLLSRMRAYDIVLSELAKVDAQSWHRVVRLYHDISYDFSIVMHQLGYDEDDYREAVEFMMRHPNVGTEMFFAAID